MLTSLLDLAAVILLAAFAWFVWPPLTLAALAAAALAASWKFSR